MQEAKDRKHDAFTFEYHLIDLLKMSNFSFAEKQAQKLKTTSTHLILVIFY